MRPRFDALTVVDPSLAPADFNDDGAVDAADRDVFEACATGPGIAYDANNLPFGCTLTPIGQGRIAADFDQDGDVDQSDFGIFQQCYGWAGDPADPNCAGR